MTSTIETRILQALGDYLKREPSGIPVDAVLRDDLGLDSMATIELLYRVEEAFDLQIPDQDLQAFRSVRDVVTYVERRLSASSPGRPAPSPKAPAQAPSSRKRPAAKPAGAKTSKSPKRKGR